MKNVGSTLVNAQESIGGEITRVKAAVDGLIGSGFATAAASGAYSEQFTQLSKALGDVNESLGPLGQFLTSYAEQVEQMDTQFSSMLKG